MSETSLVISNKVYHGLSNELRMKHMSHSSSALAELLVQFIVVDNYGVQVHEAAMSNSSNVQQSRTVLFTAGFGRTATP